MIKKVCDNIFCFPITLPRSPLKYLNCYVIKSGSGKNLLIDTGYALPESRRDLEAGIRELELTPENTDVFLTHIHADHTGNAAYLAKLGYHIIMGERDYHGVIEAHSPDFYGARQKSIDAGVPADVLDAIFVHNPSPIMLPEMFPAETVKAGDVLEYGGHRLECLPTYGHSPGTSRCTTVNMKSSFSATMSCLISLRTLCSGHGRMTRSANTLKVSSPCRSYR